MYPPEGPSHLNVPLPDPSVLAPQKHPVEQGLSLITPLFALGTALGGSPQAGAAFLGGAHQTLQRQEKEKQAQQEQQQQLALDQQRMAMLEQQREQQQIAQIEAAKQKLVMDYAVKARAAKTRPEYEQIIQEGENIGASFLGMRPNTIRSAAPYLAPNASEVMARAAQAFLKNPANAQAIDQGKLDGSIMLDVQGDGIPIKVPVKDVLAAGGVQLDPQTGAPLVVPKEAKNTAGVQLDDEAFLGEVAKFEAEKGRPATAAERGGIAVRVKRMMEKPAAAGSDGGLKDYQKFTAGEKLADKWTKSNTAVKEMNRQFQLMQTGLSRFKQGDKLGGSQAVLVTFQKILDPTSVVRESEYARTASGLSLMSRLEGYMDKLQQGGAGVPQADLSAMVQTAKQFLADMQGYTAGQRKRIGSVAKQYGIDDSLVFDDLTPPDEASGPSVGSIVTLKDGRRVKVTGTNPDGSIKGTVVR
jgi:hypothetical protein